MKQIVNSLRIFYLLGFISSAYGQVKLPPPVITMPGSSVPLVSPQPVPIIRSLATVQAAATPPPVNMKILVLAGDASEYSYQAITTYLKQIGVPYTGIAVDTLTPDASGNRLSGLPLTDAAGHGLYQGFIYTNSTFGVCNPTCVNLLTNADFSTLSSYVTQFQIRVVTYYTYPEAKWGLSIVGSGASYTAANPLNAKLTTAGAAIFSYINSANTIPVGGSGTGAIYAYQATPVAAAGETTTPILMAGSNVIGVTHVTATGQQSLSLTMDNYPTLLHSLAFSYGVINWVTNGVFIGQRRIYLNPQIDDILFGDRLYAPTLPQCPADPSCPVIIGTGSDVQALVNWQNSKHTDPQLTNLRSTYVYVGLGSTPAFAPVPDTVTPAMKTFASAFGWINHTWTHGDLDCYTLSSANACIPATFDQSLFEIERNRVFAQSLPIPDDSTGVVTPFNGGLSNLAFFQAAAQEGVTSVISPNDPPSPGTGAPSLVPSILLIPRRVTNLFYDVDSPKTGVYGSLPDEYNSLYGPGGTTPTFTTNQTYAQIIANESTTLLQLRMLMYEVYPLGFHNSNVIAYDGTNSLMTDLFNATIQKYEQLYTLPIVTLTTQRDMAPLLLNRASYNNSGVTGVYTPGVSVVLTSPNAGVIPVTGACAQATCPTYGGQIQDSVSMAAGSSVTLSLTAGVGASLSAVTVNPGSVTGRTPAQGLVVLNGIATAATVVTLTSDSALASVPSNVTVNVGDSGASFSVATGSVAASTTVHITATYNGVSRIVPLVVTPGIALSGFSLSSSSAAAGVYPVATLSLTSAAPAGGIVVSLISNNAAATTPSQVTIPAGSSSATFNVTTLAVGTSTAGTLVAVYNGVNLPANLTVTPGIPLALSTVTFIPPTVLGGVVSTGTVTLNGLAPAGGVAVSLASSSASVVVPATVYVNAGASTATFTATTSSVAASVSATITATYNSGTATGVLVVTPSFGLLGVSLNPVSVLSGASSTGTVTLTSAAPAAGTVVSLSSDNAAAVVPASVTVSSGSTSANFTITTSSVTIATNVKINASYGGGTETSTLTISPGLALASVSTNPGSVIAGSSSTGTVTLTTAAPAGGTVVTLSSNNAAAMVPASVTVSAGSTSANFTVTTSSVAASTSVTITAAYAGLTKTTSLTLSPAVALSSVSTNPGSVVAGSASTGTVTLTTAAPAGGIVVALTSNNAAAVVPASVTVSAGSTTANFTVTTSSVTVSTGVTISAMYGGVTKTSSLTVSPGAALTSVSTNPGTVVAGSSSTGMVTLSATAPAGGTVVTLSSNNPAAVVPASLTVSAGSNSANFTITTSSVTVSTNVTIAAAYNGVTLNTTLNVTPAVALASVSTNPATVTAGTNSTGTVTLTTAAPAAGTVVTLSSNNAAAAVPASVTVSAGSTSANFTITTSSVTASTGVTISATYNGLSKTSTLTVNPTAALASLSMNPNSVIAGTSSTGTVTLTAPAPTGGIVVNLSDDSSSVGTPASVTVTAGNTTANFTSTTSAVTAITTATISATYGNVTKTASLIVTPVAKLSSVSFNPSLVTAGIPSIGIVTLTAPAPSGGIVVTLSDNSSAVALPATVTVSAGSSTAAFTATTSAVSGIVVDSITASYAGVTVSTTLTVTPPVALSGLSLNPTTVTGGTNSTGMVTLSAPAPAGGIVVALSDNSGATTLPATVTVSAGSSSAQFTIATTAVSASVTDTISASYNGVVKTTVLTIAAPVLSAFSVSPNSVNGWSTATGTVTLTGPAPAGGAVVSLSSDVFFLAQVPQSITIPAGSSTGTFAVNTLPFWFTVTVNLTATYSGNSLNSQITINGIF